MSGILGLVAIFVVVALVLGVFSFFAYRRVLRKAKGIERGLKMVPLLIHLPPPADETEQQTMRDVRDVMREKASQAQTLYDLIAGTAQPGLKSNFYGQRHIAFEVIASNGLVHFFTAVPVALVSTVEQAIQTAYPGARIEEVEDHNIFNPQGKLSGTVGGELVLKQEYSYPIETLDQMERDPIEGLLNALIKLQQGDGAAVQIMLRPAKPKWSNRGKFLVARKRRQRQGTLDINPADIAKAAYKSPDEWHQESVQYQPSKLEETMLQAMEEKMRHPGFEILIRVIASSSTYDKAQMILRNIINSFALYEAPGSNGFQFLEARDIQGLVTAFIFRFFPPEVTSNILATNELATLFHLPNDQFNASTAVERQLSKQVDGPVNLPSTGLLLGYNMYRGVKKEIRLSDEDRRRHMYIIGQTGTGKSTILENIVVQDMLAGRGLAFIDPHGDAAEKLLKMVPKERAEDVVYFNPADMEHPLGINLFEFDSPEQKDFIIQESINMLYKLYDPDKTGIIGPRFEHWFRSAALTLMADPQGSSFIEIPKVFTDTTYLKNKFKYLSDPTVIDFWTKEMGQTSDYHKSEMLGWFVSKFGAFQSNDMMRNIIGQTESAFNIRDIMDQKKILIVNLSKGLTGELNSKLLGMIFVIKIQAAAMSRSNIPESERSDFSLIVDEFQNFSTDSFASILSEARKYRLNLIVANQFIGQLSEEIREAVFGNIGTMMSYRCGPEDAEFLVKQFQPMFNERDLINIPNFNAVMKLLIGGLPSLPFSITAMPPLGQMNDEMGLAVKQLSAAKFGVQRNQVEADIFARLQNQPRPALNPPVPAPAPVAAPQPVAQAPVQSAPQPAAQSQAVASSTPPTVQILPPKPIESVAQPTEPVSQPADVAQPSPAVQQPAAQVAATAPIPQMPGAVQTSPPKVDTVSPQPISAAIATPSPVATTPPAKTTNTPTPKTDLSLNSLKAAPPAVKTAPQAERSAPKSNNITDIVGPAVKPVEVDKEPVNKQASESTEKPVALIEAHETDGRTDEDQKIEAVASPPQTAPITTPNTIPQSTPQPAPTTQNKPPQSSDTANLNEELQHDIEESMKLVAKPDDSAKEVSAPAVSGPGTSDAIEDITEKLNEELEEKLESASHPLIKPKETPIVIKAPQQFAAPVASPAPAPITKPAVNPAQTSTNPVAQPAQPKATSNPVQTATLVVAQTPPAGKTMIATHRTPRIPDVKPVSPVPTEPAPTPTYAESAAPKVVAPAPAPSEPIVESDVATPPPPAPGTSFAPASPIKMTQPEPVAQQPEAKADPVSTEADQQKSDLKPGEIRIDKDGNVITG